MRSSSLDMVAAVDVERGWVWLDARRGGASVKVAGGRAGKRR